MCNLYEVISFELVILVANLSCNIVGIHAEMSGNWDPCPLGVYSVPYRRSSGIPENFMQTSGNNMLGIPATAFCVHVYLTCCYNLRHGR